MRSAPLHAGDGDHSRPRQQPDHVAIALPQAAATTRPRASNLTTQVPRSHRWRPLAPALRPTHAVTALPPTQATTHARATATAHPPTATTTRAGPAPPTTRPPRSHRHRRPLTPAPATRPGGCRAPAGCGDHSLPPGTPSTRPSRTRRRRRPPTLAAAPKHTATAPRPRRRPLMPASAPHPGGYRTLADGGNHSRPPQTPNTGLPRAPKSAPAPRTTRPPRSRR